MTLSTLQPTAPIEQRLRIRQHSVANAERATLERAIEKARADLAEREERVGLLLKIYDAECASRAMGRVQYCDDAAANLAAERQEVTRLAAAIRGLQRALDDAK